MNSSNRLGYYCAFAALTLGVWSCAERAVAIGVIYDENFGGLSTDILHGTTVDFDGTGAATTTKWQAYTGTSNGGFKADGTMPTDNVSQGAWLPFVPQPGNTYTLSASFTGIGPDGSSVAWYAIGFAKGLPPNPETGQNRLNELPTLGRAWMNFRPNNPTSPDSPNVTHRFGLNGGDSNLPWTDPTLARAEGGDLDVQIVLDTNPAVWTASFFAKRPADSLYTAVSTPALPLNAQDILGIGFVRTTGTISGKITNFTLESVAPIYIPGDVNSDTFVNDLDFNIIRDHLFQSGTATRSQGDLTNDGLVDFNDFRQWKTAHEGGGAGAGAGLDAAVPEPAIALLAMIATAGSLFVGRRRRDIAPRQNP